MPAEHGVRRGGSRRVSLGLPAPLACGGWGWAAGGREGERRRCVAERCLLREHAEACLFVRARSPQGPAPGGLGLRRGSGSSRLAVGRVSREPEEELLFGVRGFKIFGGGGVYLPFTSFKSSSWLRGWKERFLNPDLARVPVETARW